MGLISHLLDPGLAGMIAFFVTFVVTVVDSTNSDLVFSFFAMQCRLCACGTRIFLFGLMAILKCSCPNCGRNLLDGKILRVAPIVKGQNKAVNVRTGNGLKTSGGGSR